MVSKCLKKSNFCQLHEPCMYCLQRAYPPHCIVSRFNLEGFKLISVPRQVYCLNSVGFLTRYLEDINFLDIVNFNDNI